MFCTNCGQSIDNDSLFCVHCGKKLKSETTPGRPDGFNTEVFNSEKAKGFFKIILDIFANPTTSVNILKENLSFKSNLILVIVSLVLIPLINIFALKSILMNFFINISKFACSFTGRTIPAKQIVEFKQVFSENFNAAVPYADVILFNIMFYVLFFGLIGLFLFGTLKLFKIDLTFKDIVRVATLPLLIVLAFTMINPIALSLGVTISLFISMATLVLISLTTYTGFKILVNDIEVFPYLFSGALVLSYMFTVYMSFKILLSSILSFGMPRGFL